MTKRIYSVPYFLWILFFVIVPLAMLLWQSFFDLNGHFTLNNYILYFSSGTYLLMTWNSILYALIITVATLVISYPVAYVLTKLKMKQFWLMLIILPTWVNLLLKAYAFIGIFGKYGSVNNFLQFLGIGRTQILFTDLSFILVASYISIPFMVLPIFNALNDLDDNLVNASADLGASRFQTFTQVIGFNHCCCFSCSHVACHENDERKERLICEIKIHLVKFTSPLSSSFYMHLFFTLFFTHSTPEVI